MRKRRVNKKGLPDTANTKSHKFMLSRLDDFTISKRVKNETYH